jgi:RNA polymerase sigma factor for flagellar operon FliA
MSAPGPDHARLIEECQGLVRTLAQQVRGKSPPHVELDDLIAYGQVGLAEAARDFDATRGHRFSTFAYYRIRGAIYDGLSKLCGLSRGHYQQARYEQMAGQVLAESAAQPAADSASGQDRDLCWFRDLSRNLAVASLITAVGSCDDAPDKSQSDELHTSPPAMAIDKEISQILHQLVNSLPNQERELVRAAYFEGLTLQEAGQRMGISKSWATRLHARALERLARSLKVLDLVS